MEKNKLIQLKNSIITLSLAGVMIGSAGCTNNNNQNEIPKRYEISSSNSQFDRYTKTIIKNGIPQRVYKSGTIYLFINKDNYDITECIYIGSASNHGETIRDYAIDSAYGSQLYDLESGELLAYHTGHLLDTCTNKKYFIYLLENNYQVYVGNICNYIEDFTWQEYYSLEEIRALEPQIVAALKQINSIKTK